MEGAAMNYVQRARAALARPGSTKPGACRPESRRARERSEKSEESPLGTPLNSLNSLSSRPGHLEMSLPANASVDEDGIVERTAIIEVETGVPREWAEAVARLCAMPRPASIPEGRWRQLVDDSARFVECHGAAAAAAGWATLDIFGCCARRPLARIDMAGATAMLESAEVVRVAADRIVLRRIGSKNEMSLYRGTGPNEARALLWELDGANGPRAIARSASG